MSKNRWLTWQPKQSKVLGFPQVGAYKTYKNPPEAVSVVFDGSLPANLQNFPEVAEFVKVMGGKLRLPTPADRGVPFDQWYRQQMKEQFRGRA
jgi:hypothetical protein